MQSLRRAEVPLTRQEHDVRALLDAGAPVDPAHPLTTVDPVLARGLPVVTARRLPTYGPWLGGLSAIPAEIAERLDRP